MYKARDPVIISLAVKQLTVRDYMSHDSILSTSFLFELLGEYCPALMICYCLFCRVVHSAFKQYFFLTPHKGVQYESLPSELLVVVFHRFVLFTCSFYISCLLALQLFQ